MITIKNFLLPQLIDAEGHIRLVDLGFALQIAYKSWSICGTTEYMGKIKIFKNFQKFKTTLR